MTADDRGDTATAGIAAGAPAATGERAAFQRIAHADAHADADAGFDSLPPPPRRWRVASARPWFLDRVSEEQRFGTAFVWLPIAMMAGATLDLTAARDVPVPAIAVPAALAAVATCIAHRKGRGVMVALAALLFFAGMAAAALQIARTPTRLLDGTVVTHVRGEVLAREGDGHGGWRYRIRLVGTSDPVIRRPPRVVRISARGQRRPVAVGEGIAGLARLSPMSGPALPGGYDFGFNAFFARIGAIGFFYGPPHPSRLDGARLPDGPLTRLSLAVEKMREAISQRVRAVLPGEDGALASALIVAKRRAIPDAVTTALRNSGLAHILAISGLHMALVAGTLFFLLRSALGMFPSLVEAIAVKKHAAAAALVVATAYLALSGGAVSTVRAWVMLAIMLVAVMFDRPALTMRNVAIAAFVIMTFNPAAVVGPSFQMSFAATMALVAGYALFRRYAASRMHDGARAGILQIAIRFAAGIAFTSLVAGAATAIFAAYHFQRVATLGLLGNLLAMPVISFVVMPFGLIAVLLMPYGFEALPLKIMGAGLHVVIAIASHVSALGGTVTTGRLHVAALLVFVTGFALLVLLRSSLRLVGLLPIAAAIAMIAWPPGPWRPAVLIAEDGRLVGLPQGREIATNRSRPSAFIFKQWLTAFDRTAGPRPTVQKALNRVETKSREDGRSPPADAGLVDAMATGLRSLSSAHFTCVRKVWCGARTGTGLTIVWVSDPAYLGPACDIARIVVTPRRVRMRRCRSGALLFTAETLRRSGSVEIDVMSRSAAARTRPELRPPGDAMSPAPRPKAGSNTCLSIRIRSAVGGTIRPWTIQRYYDWRSRSFDFSNSVKPVRTLVVSTD